MWFWLAIIALICWSGSDLFSKIGCRSAEDKYSHLKMVMAVGIVMGIHAAYEVFIGGVEISWNVIFTYLPVSLLYILSMAMGYIGLRYIELSISSPICNASGALVAILALITGDGDYPPLMLVAIALVCAGAKTTNCVQHVRKLATSSTPRAGSLSLFPSHTACLTRPELSPTISYSKSSMRTAQM